MSDEQYMSRAIEIAKHGLGMAAPNPLVGCVIVNQNRIIGEGYHRRYKTGHAEHNAILAVLPEDQHLIKGSTVYVTLEPCAHFGNTPPCCDLLIRNEVGRVMIAQEDPYPLVDGRSITKLKEQGIEVEVGLLNEKARFLSRRFLTATVEKRPYIILKWAQSADGFMGKENESVWLTAQESKRLVHKWRSEEAAILVGTNTAVTDDPQLTCRLYPGRNPVRFAIDRKGRIPLEAKLFDGAAETFIVSDQALVRDNSQCLELPFKNLWKELLDEMQKRMLSSLIVEGGASVLHQFIEADLWDEARVFESPKILNTGIEAPQLSVSPLSTVLSGQDQLHTYYR